MHKLTHVEAQRMMAVLQESLDKLALVSSLPSTPNGVLLDALYDNDLGDVATALESQVPMYFLLSNFF